MRNVFSMIVVLGFVSSALSQSTWVTQHGDTLQLIDSLSYKNQMLQSEYFVLQKDKTPFTGKAYEKLDRKTLTELSLFNGYVNGFKKEYFTEKNGQVLLLRTSFYDQANKIVVSKAETFSCGKRKSFLRYQNSTELFYVEVVEKKEVYKVKLFKNEKLVKRLKMNSPEKLKSFITQQGDMIYSHCREIGLIY